MTPIAIEELTTVAIDGTGAFDQLMRATKLHLEQEYKQGRIKGAEYSQVYLESLVAVLDQAVKYLSAEKQNALLEAQKAKVEAEIRLVEAQIALAEKQDELMLQKVKTEKAQIVDVVDGVPVTGVIGRQKTLYERQADGFLRDAEHKMAKLMADIWSVQRTTDEGFAPSTQLANASIDAVINKAKQGINV